MNEIKQLIRISQFYGSDSRYVIAGGGNTSYKNADKLWVKASGHALATITEEGFAVLDRNKLNVISQKQYPADTAAREEEVKNDLAAACITKDRRPSVETSLHNALSASFIVHLHPTLVNGLMCAQDVEQVTKKLFGDEALYIPYIDPGYILFKEVERRIREYTQAHGHEPAIILLQNHGIFVGAESTEKIQAIYDEVLGKIEKALTKTAPVGEADICACTQEIIPAIRMMASSKEGLKTLKVINNELISYFIESKERFAKISKPFSPDIIVYCKSNYIYIDSEGTEAILETARKEIEAYKAKYGYAPKVILIKGIGLVAVGDNAAGCNIIAEVYQDMMKIAYLAQSFGGEHPMTQAQIDFIDNWEVENYRRKVSAGATAGRVENKTIIVTGAAQGFGEGIARCLIQQGANIVVADLNEAVGAKTVENLNALAKSNRAIFVKTNVADTAEPARADPQNGLRIRRTRRIHQQCRCTARRRPRGDDARELRVRHQDQLQRLFLLRPGRVTGDETAEQILRRKLLRHHPDQLEVRPAGVESQLRLCGRQIRRYRPHAIVRPRAGAVPHQSERRLPR